MLRTIPLAKHQQTKRPSSERCDGFFKISATNLDKHPTPRYSHSEPQPLQRPCQSSTRKRQDEAHNQAPPDSHPPDRGHLRHTHTRSRATRLRRSTPRITCSSDDGRRNWCNIGPSRDVRLVRQISGSPCVRDSTWGVDRRGLWVDRGCRAEFIVGRAGPPPPPPGPGSGAIVTCSSNDGGRRWCDIGRSRDVRLVRQISGSPCVRGQTWDVDRRGLWVDRGCRADFRVR
ncbi:DUF3011 domain-containing protein [Tunturiibacter empetritectus]|uniref:DUF3011 domain-containing protein n=1 Tax=Tunturiibacter empetritectus TaxID=3069691 RepID=UPI003D9BAC94